ncbi:MAG: DUF2782 domain-containing protein [Betaproteobacteria bacterium]|nr:DUF2782 domain-containing protein [Betaproteobacteria bacterium]MDE2423128.1 DUF2782 domain-containing protein [Betaproteobacteria bacterium]
MTSHNFISRCCLFSLLMWLTISVSYAEDESFKAAPPPPDYGTNKNSEPADEPQVTIVERNGATFEETRYHGKLYKIKVTPKVGKPYYLIDEEGKGVWHRYDGPVDRTIVPQWVILKF